MKKFEKEENESSIETGEDKPPFRKRLKSFLLCFIFYSFFICIIIIDMFVFRHFHDWGSSISILLLELLLLTMLARMCDIDYLEILTEQILDYKNGKSE